MSESFWIGGKHAVREAVTNPERSIVKIFLSEDQYNDFLFLKNKTRKNFTIEIKTSKQIDQIFKNNSFKHQNIASLVKKIPEITIKEKIQELNSKHNSVIIILDNITDQRNIGSIIRSSVAFNVDAIIILKKNFSYSSYGIYKSASGGMEHISVITVTNIVQAIELLKKNNYWVLGLDHHANKKINSIDVKQKIALVFGSEDKGIRELVKKNCDETIKIEINKSINSLNVSNACSASLAVINHKLNEKN